MAVNTMVAILGVLALAGLGLGMATLAQNSFGGMDGGGCHANGGGCPGYGGGNCPRAGGNDCSQKGTCDPANATCPSSPNGTCPAHDDADSY
jgi:hypothetical protein